MHFAKLYFYGDEQLLVDVKLIPSLCPCGKCSGTEVTAVLQANTRLNGDQCGLQLAAERGKSDVVDQLLAEFNQGDADEAMRLIRLGHDRALTDEEFGERGKLFIDSLRLRAGLPIAA